MSRKIRKKDFFLAGIKERGEERRRRREKIKDKAGSPGLWSVRADKVDQKGK